MITINELSIEAINSALLRIQKSPVKQLAESKSVVQNISVSGGSGISNQKDYTNEFSVINNKITETDNKINSLSKEIKDLDDFVSELSDNGISSLSYDNETQELLITTESGEEYRTVVGSPDNVNLTLNPDTHELTLFLNGVTKTVAFDEVVWQNEKGVANGVASLDESGRIPYSQLPESAMEFKGSWSASTNTPHLADGSGVNGDFYICTDSGTVTFGTGNTVSFSPNDRVIYDGTLNKWVKLFAGAVASVNGKSGTVVLTAEDIDFDENNTIEEEIEKKANSSELSTVARSGSYNDLSNRPTIPPAQVQADWNETDTSSKAYIRNKPTIPTVDASLSEVSTNPVQNKEITNVMKSLPTDAILHYSFDEVPDLPDGTAVIRQNENWTTNPTETGNWYGQASGQWNVRVENNKIRVSRITGSDGNVVCNLGAIQTGKLFYIRVRFNSDMNFSVLTYNGTSVDRYKDGTFHNGDVLECYNILKTMANYLFYCSSSGNLGQDYTIEAFYVGDGSYNTPVIDNSYGGYNATNNGGLAIQGVNGKGVNLLGIKNSYLQFPTPKVQTVSWSMWFYNNGFAKEGDYPQTRMLLSYGRETSDNSNKVGINVFLVDYDKIRMVIGNKDSSVSTVYTIPQGIGNKWRHLVVEKTPTAQKMYLDGILVSQATNTNELDFNDNCKIGKLGFDSIYFYYNGLIDDVMAFGRELSETEVKALYLNRGNTPKFVTKTDKDVSDLKTFIDGKQFAEYSLIGEDLTITI